MGGRSLQYVMLSPPSTRTDGVARLELYGDARVTGGVLRLTDLLPGFSLDDVIIDGSRDEDAVWSDGQADLGLDSMHTTSLGTAILTLRRPYNALFWWEVRLDANVGSTLTLTLTLTLTRTRTLTPTPTPTLSLTLTRCASTSTSAPTRRWLGL